MTSPVRLGVSPAATPTPTGIFNLRFEALFPHARALGCTPRHLSWFICVNVGPQGAIRRSAYPVLHHSESGPLSLSVRECGAAGSASGQTACPLCPTLCQSRSRHGHASPLRPGARLHPSYLSGCMFLFYLFGVGLPCHSIFCQLWLCEEGQCVYICRHLGSLVGTFFFHFISYD